MWRNTGVIRSWHAGRDTLESSESLIVVLVNQFDQVGRRKAAICWWGLLSEIVFIGQGEGPEGST